MFKIENFTNNNDIVIKEKAGPFSILEYQKDLSVSVGNAQTMYFAQKMNVKKRQVLCEVGNTTIVTQAGAMQWTAGDVRATTGIKGVGDFIGKAFKGKATGESTIKPEYEGTGYLVLEPTYRHLFLLDTAEWGGSIVLSDGMFVACDGVLEQKIVARSNISSAVLGGEGLFNLSLKGNGIVVCESFVPREELIEITLENDVVRIDGNMAVAWSRSLEFTVERSGKSLIGSAASGEGLVNVYRGTGKILMAPVLAASI